MLEEISHSPLSFTEVCETSNGGAEVIVQLQQPLHIRLTGLVNAAVQH